MKLDKNFFFSKLDKLGFFENKPHVAVAVSGGPDSMALVYLTKKWTAKKKGKTTALIFDHKIRENSYQEALETKKILKKLKINSIILKAKKQSVKKKNMSEARNNRFDGLMNYCKKNNILHLFLGHHLDDNLETYLIRFIQGSNFEGLRAMSESKIINKINLYRPFINIPKKLILDFNKNNFINYLDDPSNSDLIYTRVKVRNFLSNTNYRKEIVSDFANIKNQMPYYKKMILEPLINSMVVIRNKFCIIKLNDLIEK